MALPDEILDELLSAHLDGVLSGDERARVERMLESDPAIEARFETLKSQSAWLSQAAYSGPGLSKDFADQVVGAAIQAATEEGCSAQHPLRKAAREERSGRFSMPQLVGLISALAASLLLVAMLVQGIGSGPSGASVAENVIDETGADSDREPVSDVIEGDRLASDDPRSSSNPTSVVEPQPVGPSIDATAGPMVDRVAENSTESKP
ncbi:MAG: zf-HC2 domain-containing protein, partial [Planctomycetota bacterium]